MEEETRPSIPKWVTLIVFIIIASEFLTSPPIQPPLTPTTYQTTPTQSSPMTHPPIPHLTTAKAKAFEIFKNAYPSGAWIEGQKALLKEKYAEAKGVGGGANGLRMEIRESFLICLTLLWDHGLIECGVQVL